MRTALSSVVHLSVLTRSQKSWCRCRRNWTNSPMTRIENGPGCHNRAALMTSGIKNWTKRKRQSSRLNSRHHYQKRNLHLPKHLSKGMTNDSTHAVLRNNLPIGRDSRGSARLVTVRSGHSPIVRRRRGICGTCSTRRRGIRRRSTRIGISRWIEQANRPGRRSVRWWRVNVSAGVDGGHAGPWRCRWHG